MSSPVQGKGSDMLDSQDQVRFEMLVLPHLDAACNLARWLLRSGADAEDAAQEALLRAYRYFPGFHGGDVRSWLLQIVRNTCYTWLEKNRRVKDITEVAGQLGEVARADVERDRRDPGGGQLVAIGRVSQSGSAPHFVIGCQRPRDGEGDLPGRSGDQDLLSAQGFPSFSGIASK